MSIMKEYYLKIIHRCTVHSIHHYKSRVYIFFKIFIILLQAAAQARIS